MELDGRSMEDLMGSLLARYATKSMLTTAAKRAMRGTFDAAKKAIPHLFAHKVASVVGQRAAGKKRKKVAT